MAIGKIVSSQVELNFNLVWNQMPASARQAFTGVSEKVKLPSGFALYKFTEFRIANHEGKITEWWNPVAPYGNDAGLAARMALARHLGAIPADLTRVVAAVREDWNALTHVLQANLLKPVYAFWGQCSMQRRLKDGETRRPGIAGAPTRNLPGVSGAPSRNLPGYAWQFYIPNLTSDHIRQIGRLAL